MAGSICGNVYAPESSLPESVSALKIAVQDRLHPAQDWLEEAIQLHLGRTWSDLSERERTLARLLLPIEELSELLLAFRLRQLSLPPEKQDRSPLTPERLGIPPSSVLYHPARRALAPVTVATLVDHLSTGHYLVNSTDERYAAGRQIEGKRALYDGRFYYGVLDTKGRIFFATQPNGERIRCGNDITVHAAAPWSSEAYGAAKSTRHIQEQGKERCVAFTALLDDGERKQVLAQHRLLFARFHELDIEPEPVIELTLTDGILTLKSDVFVWGVLLSFGGYRPLQDNAFDLLPGIPYSLPWDEAALRKPRISATGNSLFLKS